MKVPRLGKAPIVYATVGAALILLLGDVPTGAQDNQDTVTKSFRLTLYGQVPERNRFYVVFSASPSAAAGTFTFCGGPGAEQCRGGGAVYTESVEVKRGAQVGGAFARTGPGIPGGGETFLFLPTERITDDTTNAAYYSFEEKADGGQDLQDGQEGTGDEPAEDGQAPPGLPATGGGGLTAAATRSSSYPAAR